MPSKQQQPSQPVLKPDFRLDSYPENLATPSHLRQSMPCLPGGGGYYPTPKPRHSMAFNSARGFVGAPYNYNEEDSLLGLGAGPEMACSTPSQISKVLFLVAKLLYNSLCLSVSQSVTLWGKR